MMGQKKDWQTNIRIDDEVKNKLDVMKVQTGRSSSDIIRQLILDNEVKVYYGMREIMQSIAQVHDQFNKYELKLDSDEHNLQKTFEYLGEVAKENPEANRIDGLIFRAECLIEQLHEKYKQQKEIAESELNEYVNFKCRK